MDYNRRDFMKLAGFGILGLGTSACGAKFPKPADRLSMHRKIEEMIIQEVNKYYERHPEIPVSQKNIINTETDLYACTDLMKNMLESGLLKDVGIKIPGQYAIIPDNGLDAYKEKSQIALDYFTPFIREGTIKPLILRYGEELAVEDIKNWKALALGKDVLSGILWGTAIGFAASNGGGSSGNGAAECIGEGGKIVYELPVTITP